MMNKSSTTTKKILAFCSLYCSRAPDGIDCQANPYVYPCHLVDVSVDSARKVMERFLAFKQFCWDEQFLIMKSALKMTEEGLLRQEDIDHYLSLIIDHWLVVKDSRDLVNEKGGKL